MNSPLQFDIYVKRTDSDFTKIFRAKDVIDRERIKRYADKGIRYFYVSKDDYEVYTLYIEKFGQIAVNSSEKFSSEELAELVKELVNYVMYEVVESFNVDEKLIKNASNAVACSVNILKNDPKGLIRVMALMANQQYQTKHAITVCMLSVLLAMQAGIESDLVLTNIGLGAFLHDIGVSQLTFDPEALDDLTEDQKNEVWRHPQLGRQLLEGIKGIREEVFQIIMQHHEWPNGKGYPNGLRDNEIYFPAKIVAIADCFSSLITKRTFRKAYTAHEALALMKSEVGKFDPDLLEKFKKMLRLN